MKLTAQDIKEIEQVQERIEELHQWLDSHSVFDDDFEQQRRNLSIALYKEKQIKARSERSKVIVTPTYSLPTFK